MKNEKLTEQNENNFKYHPPTTQNIADFTWLRDIGKHVAEIINDVCPDSREKSIAITKLEEAVMWANAAIARNGT